MVVYCVGNILEKRRFFKKQTGESVVNIDNDDVVYSFNLFEKTYLVIGKNPFADLGVAEYIAYSKSLSNKLPLGEKYIKALLRSCGYMGSLSKKLGKISRVELRSVLLASKIQPDTKTLFVNFDGLSYNKKNYSAMIKSISKWSKTLDVFVAVSDMRLVPVFSNVQLFRDGKIQFDCTLSKPGWQRINKCSGVISREENMKSVVVTNI